MNTTPTLIKIPLHKIIPHPDNPRTKAEFAKDHPKMVELTQSIAAIGGLLMPCLVTPHSKREGHYQLIAGERRMWGATYAQVQEISCMVAEMTEEEAVTAMLMENLQRESVDPIMEARCIAKLQRRGFNLEQIAQRLGKNYGWVQRRARITGLNAAWMDLIRDSLPSWSIEHLALIARYDAPMQQTLLGWIDSRIYQAAHWTSDDLRKQCAHFLHDVTKAPWNPRDPLLVKEAGACSACPKRTSCQSSLFDDLPSDGLAKDGDYCTDANCWEAKTKAHVAGRISTLEANEGPVIRISQDAWASPKDAGFLGYHDYVVTTKKAEGAKLAVFIDGTKVGKTAWITLPSRALAKATAAASSGLAEKRAQLAGRRQILAYRGLLECLDLLKPNREQDEVSENAPPMSGLPLGTVPSHRLQLVWAMSHGVGHDFSLNLTATQRAIHQQDTGSTEVPLLERTEADLQVAFWGNVFPTMRRALHEVVEYRKVDSPLPGVIASMIGVSLEVFVEKATEVIREPKAWRSQYPEAYAAEAAGAAAPASGPASTAAEEAGGEDSADIDLVVAEGTPSIGVAVMAGAGASPQS